MTVRKLVIHTKFDIDKVELEMIKGDIILTVNGQQSVLDRAAGDMIRLWLQEHLNTNTDKLKNAMKDYWLCGCGLRHPKDFVCERLGK